MKLDINTVEVLNRFRQERETLASLEHPNIATILDGGATSDGRPFFVMEYVEGLPIDAFCREGHLGLEARLRLFLRVCEAVAYAHGKLVIHRDLKPENILVTEAGIPKLSFSCGSPAPAYASPEQVRGLPVTTATDIHALGMVLHELLTAEAGAEGMPRRLDKDFNHIVRKATRQDPQRRHSSPDRLRDDIETVIRRITSAAR
jgi:eukaryotic-like serine/threonine-protein kinase